jgi:large subunit ribosomal protein L2
MGKRIIQQRRGKGSPTYRAPPYKFRPSLKYKDQPGRIVDIVNDRIRNSPLAEIVYSDRSKGYIIAPEGIRVGDSIENVVVLLSQVTEGMQISAIETSPNSGPKLCRTPGSFATMVSRRKNECIIQLPSKKKKKLNPNCRVIVGIPAGEGRGEKPFVKAGKKWIAMHARGKLYPRTSGVAMNVVDHPFGGGYSGLGKHKTVSRHTPPGRKVGSISPRRTGKRK